MSSPVGYSRFNFLFTQGEANPLFPNTPRFTFNNSDVDYTASPRTQRAVNTYQLINNITYIAGTHVMKFGGNLRIYQHNDRRGDVGGVALTPAISLSRTVRPAGFNFPAVSTATTPGIASNDLNRLQGMVNDLLGIHARSPITSSAISAATPSCPSSPAKSRSPSGPRASAPSSSNFFAQDDWKIRKNLSVSYGVRWELDPPPREASSRTYVPDKNIDGSQGLVTFSPGRALVQDCRTPAPSPASPSPGRPATPAEPSSRTGYTMAFDPIATFQVASVASAVPGQVFRCTATVGGATTPGCQSVPDVRLSNLPTQLARPTPNPQAS
jgi:hypothetical protein